MRTGLLKTVAIVQMRADGASIMEQSGEVWRYFKDRLNRISDGLAIEWEGKEVCGLSKGEKQGLSLFSLATLF